jgi:hypothetical protein
LIISTAFSNDGPPKGLFNVTDGAAPATGTGTETLGTGIRGKGVSEGVVVEEVAGGRGGGAETVVDGTGTEAATAVVVYRERKNGEKKRVSRDKGNK